MVIQYFLNGIMIGLVFGMPIGAVGTMSIQRTITHGPMAGLITGSASSLADVIYACVGAFGLTVISDFLLEYQMPINMIGALLLVFIAIKMVFKKENLRASEESDRKEYLKMFFSSFAVSITNPAAIISFLFAFSVFGIHGSIGFVNAIQLVIGVLISTLSWWLLLAIIVNLMKQKLNAQWLHSLNIVFGIVLIAFSCGVIIKII